MTASLPAGIFPQAPTLLSLFKRPESLSGDSRESNSPSGSVTSRSRSSEEFQDSSTRTFGFLVLNDTQSDARVLEIVLVFPVDSRILYEVMGRITQRSSRKSCWFPLVTFRPTPCLSGTNWRLKDLKKFFLNRGERPAGPYWEIGTGFPAFVSDTSASPVERIDVTVLGPGRQMTPEREVFGARRIILVPLFLTVPSMSRHKRNLHRVPNCALAVSAKLAK